MRVPKAPKLPEPTADQLIAQVEKNYVADLPLLTRFYKHEAKVFRNKADELMNLGFTQGEAVLLLTKSK
jgi:hypothetical protein